MVQLTDINNNPLKIEDIIYTPIFSNFRLHKILSITNNKIHLSKITRVSTIFYNSSYSRKQETVVNINDINVFKNILDAIYNDKQSDQDRYKYMLRKYYFNINDVNKLCVKVK